MQSEVRCEERYQVAERRRVERPFASIIFVGFVIQVIVVFSSHGKMGRRRCILNYLRG